MRRSVTVLVATLAMTSVWSGSAIAQRDARRATAARPMLVSLQPGVEITPIISSATGLVLSSSTRAYRTGSGLRDCPDRLEVFMNHELSTARRPAWSRVSHLTLNRRATSWRRATPSTAPRGTSTSARRTLDMIDGVPWYFTGEEWIASPKGGSRSRSTRHTGRFETPQFGSLTTRTSCRCRAWLERRSTCPRTRSGCGRRPTRTSPTTSPTRSRATAPSGVGARRPGRRRPVVERHRRRARP